MQNPLTLGQFLMAEIEQIFQRTTKQTFFFKFQGQQNGPLQSADLPLLAFQLAKIFKIFFQRQNVQQKLNGFKSSRVAAALEVVSAEMPYRRRSYFLRYSLQ